MQAPAFTKEQAKIVADRYANGVSAPVIANEFGVSKMAVYRIVHRAGLVVHRSRVSLADGVKRCGMCREIKSFSDFRSSGSTLNRFGLSSMAGHCRKCAAEYDKRNGYTYRKNRGINRAERQSLLVKQSGKCAICGRTKTAEAQFHVDHCHETGRTRGLLCRRCNIVMGHIDGGNPVGVDKSVIDQARAYKAAHGVEDMH